MKFTCYAGQISLGWISEIYEDREILCQPQRYVVVGCRPTTNLRILRGENCRCRQT